MGVCIKRLAKVKFKLIPYSPSVHWTSHLNVEGSQAWSDLGKSMLTVLHHLLVLYVHGYGFKEDLLNNTPAADGRLTYLLFPVSFCLPFLKLLVTFALLQLSGSSPDCRDLWKGDQPHSDIGRSLSTFAHIPAGPTDLGMSKTASVRICSGYSWSCCGAGGALFYGIPSNLVILRSNMNASFIVYEVLSF